MSETPENEIIKFKLDIHLGATITVQSASGTQDWIRPAVTSGMTWRYIPSEDQVKNAVEFITHFVLEPTLGDISKTIVERERAIKQQMT